MHITNQQVMSNMYRSQPDPKNKQTVNWYINVSCPMCTSHMHVTYQPVMSHVHVTYQQVMSHVHVTYQQVMSNMYRSHPDPQNTQTVNLHMNESCPICTSRMKKSCLACIGAIQTLKTNWESPDIFQSTDNPNTHYTVNLHTYIYIYTLYIHKYVLSAEISIRITQTTEILSTYALHSQGAFSTTRCTQSWHLCATCFEQHVAHRADISHPINSQLKLF